MEEYKKNLNFYESLIMYMFFLEYHITKIQIIRILSFYCYFLTILIPKFFFFSVYPIINRFILEGDVKFFLYDFLLQFYLFYLFDSGIWKRSNLKGKLKTVQTKAWSGYLFKRNFYCC